VVRAETQLDKLAQGVEFLRDELARADDAECAGTMALLNIAHAIDHLDDGFAPGDSLEASPLFEQRMHGAVRSGQRVVLAETLGTELAEIHRVVLPAAHRDRFAFAEPDLHAAADGAVA